MSTKIQVRGLNPDTSKEELKAHFEQFGFVEEITLNTDPDDNKPNGSAIIAMTSAEHAQKAITTLHTKDLHGRRLSVNQSRTQHNRI